MNNKEFVNKIICADTLELLPKLESNSIDVVLTDPPYFLDKLDNNWDYEKVSSSSNHYIIKSGLFAAQEKKQKNFQLEFQVV